MPRSATGTLTLAGHQGLVMIIGPGWSWSIGSEELSYLAGRSLRHQAPGAEHQDAMGGPQDAGIMGGEDHATAALADFPQGLDHDVRRLVVHLSGGLVGEDDVRIGCESPGHRDSLLLPE